MNEHRTEPKNETTEAEQIICPACGLTRDELVYSPYHPDVYVCVECSVKAALPQLSMSESEKADLIEVLKAHQVIGNSPERT